MSQNTRISQMAEILRGKVQEMKEFSEHGIKLEEKGVVVTTDDKAKYQKLLAECQELKGLIEGEKFITATPEYIQALEDAGPSAAMTALAGMPNRMAMKSLGTLFTQSDEFKDFVRTLGPNLTGKADMGGAFETDAYDITRSAMEKKDVYGAADAGTLTRGIGTVVQFDPVVPRQQRASRVRDLFPQATTAANLIDYFQVVGFKENSGDGNAQTVADYNQSNSTFGLKPQSQLKWRPQSAPVRTIAHWEAAHRNVIADVPQLQATINNELLYGLALQEDFQLLLGDGLNENIKGLLNFEDIQLYTAPNNEIKSDSLRKAATLTVLANYAPNGYVLHPFDWESIEIQKGTGDGQYMLFTNIAVGVNAQVWRQPVVETSAMNQGTFLTGAFGAGAQVYDRMRASIRIAEQHGDFFVRNAIVILCEERLALAVKRPEAFVKGTFF